MDFLSHINKKVLWGVVALLILIVLLGYLFRRSPPEAAITELAASPLEGVLGRELLGTLDRLKSTTLDTSIFSDPVFTGLRDFGVSIAPQPVGRRNPFAPFGASAAAGAGAAQKTTAASPPATSAAGSQTAPRAGPSLPPFSADAQEDALGDPDDFEEFSF